MSAGTALATGGGMIAPMSLRPLAAALSLGISLASGGVAAAPEQGTDVVSQALYENVRVIVTRRGELFRVEAGRWVPIELGLEGAARRIQAVAVYGGDLWLGTEAGLVRVAVTSCGHRLDRVAPGPVVGLALRAGRLAVRTPAGDYSVGPEVFAEPDHAAGGDGMAAELAAHRS